MSRPVEYPKHADVCPNLEYHGADQMCRHCPETRLWLRSLEAPRLRTVSDHLAQPGPLHWAWSCTICGEPVRNHIHPVLYFIRVAKHWTLRNNAKKQLIRLVLVLSMVLLVISTTIRVLT